MGSEMITVQLCSELVRLDGKACSGQVLGSAAFLASINIRSQ